MEYNMLIANTIVPLISKFGVTRTLSRSNKTEATYDPISGEYVGGTSTTYYEITCIRDNVNRETTNGTILSSDAVFYISPSLATEPIIGDTINDNGKVYEIVLVELVKPADLVLLYTVYARVV